MKLAYLTLFIFLITSATGYGIWRTLKGNIQPYEKPLSLIFLTFFWTFTTGWGVVLFLVGNSK